jgi:glutamyl-tRNA synthetase
MKIISSDKSNSEIDAPRIRVRFAPSPTGFLHIGSLRTALYNELLAKNKGGDFILRIEDTDRARAVEGGIENICRTLEDCGIVPNEGVWIDNKNRVIQRGDFGPYVQSERQQKHLEYAKDLIRMNKAYYCFCSSERLEKLRQDQQIAKQPTMYDGLCRAITNDEAEKRIAKGESYVVRLKLPKTGNVTVIDEIHGEIKFEWAGIDDQVIIKSDGMPTYHLAATCDDHDMVISHVLRGDEWLPSTPKHVFIYEAFGWTIPKFAHLPLLLNSDHSKLSKRQGDVAVTDYLSKGYLPEAIINFVALLGWNPGTDLEVFSHDELVEHFDLAKVNKSGAVFNVEKLDWLNSQYLRTIPQEQYLSLTHPFVQELTDNSAFIDRALLLVRDRVVKLPDVVSLTEYLFRSTLDLSTVSLTWKTQPPAEATERIEAVKETLERMSDEEIGNIETVELRIKSLILEKGWGNGDTLWPVRVALSGKERSPGPFELISTYGKERSLQRLKSAIQHLENLV